MDEAAVFYQSASVVQVNLRGFAFFLPLNARGEFHLKTLLREVRGLENDDSFVSLSDAKALLPPDIWGSLCAQLNPPPPPLIDDDDVVPEPSKKWVRVEDD